MLKQAFRFLGIGFFLSGAIIYALVHIGYLKGSASRTAQTPTPVTVITTSTVNQSAQPSNANNTPAQTTEAATTEANQSTQEQAATPAASGEVVKLSVVSGDYSFTVAQKLAEAGVITDANAFNAYLAEQNLATIIQNGTFSVQKGQSFEELGKILTTYPGN